jgi:hypothetical protein
MPLTLLTVLLIPLLVGCWPTAMPTPVPVSPPAVATLSPRAIGPDAVEAWPTTGPAGEQEVWDVYAAALRPGFEPELTFAGMTRYRLDVTLPSDLSHLTGQASILYTNREGEPLGTVYLRLYPNLWGGGMTTADLRVNGRSVSPVLPAEGHVLGLVLAGPLPPGASAELSLRFAVPIPAGEGVGNYGEFAFQEGILALAHFYPTVAVYDDQGWHLKTPSSQGDVIYHDASLYDVTLTAPADLVVVATGATVGRVDNGDGTATWRLAGGPMRDFNIVASTAYQGVSEQVGDVTVNSYFLPQDTAAGRDVLTWAANALRTYETAFGAYPYQELDVVATATTAGGIEYPGLIVIATWLYRDSRSWDFCESATAHEVAHQWWYNVVGNDQINAPWLDEALAQYSTYLYFHDQYGERGGQEFLDAMRQRWARVNYAQKPIGLSVDAYEGREYGAIIYGRGPLFFVALRDQIGEEAMAELLRRYYSGYTWRIATPAEFQALAEEVAGQDLAALFAEWVYPATGD